MFLSLRIFSQYYSNIDPTSSSFIPDLENLIRSNYVKITYDNYKTTIIPDYESKDNGDGTRSVFGVYTGHEYVYTEPFAWDTLSREHTWCYSWMPSHGSTSTDEYSDQHHLFPVHQNKANVRRSNHPLGIVQNVTYQYLDGKLGTNAAGETVYEPRDEHKGDAARAILYMTVRYDGTNGNTWNFDWLNNVKLPDLDEAPQSLEMLLQWHEQDPPDKWEIERNDYIYSKQKNRNPFVDHPEYVSYIDFNDLSKLNPTFDAEPDNPPSNFLAEAHGDTIVVKWNDVTSGNVLPSGYLLIAFEGDDYFLPMDGVEYSADSVLSDGKAVLNIDYSEPDSVVFTDLDSARYYFTIYSYGGSGTSVNYLIDTLVRTNAEAYGDGSSNDDEGGSGDDDDNGGEGVLVFTEYVEGSSYNKALELYNKGDADVDLAAEGYTIEIYYNGSDTPGSTIDLSGTVAQGEVFVIAHSSAEQAILDVADQTSGSLSFNGDDAVVLKKGDEVSDAIGQRGFDPGVEWGSGEVSTADNTLRLKDNAEPDKNPDDAYDPSPQFNGYDEDNIDDLGYYNAPVPVEMISFYVNVSGSNKILLNWRTATEVNNYGFEVQRQAVSDENPEWETIGFVEGAGNSNSPKSYSFTDNVSASGKYSYRLKQIDLDGSYKYSQTVEVEINVPLKFELSQNYPNPFNPTTTISYSIPTPSVIVPPKAGKQSVVNVTLAVYNALGQKVATLVNKAQAAGNYTVQFDARDLPSGIYFYTLRAGEFVATKKMILMK